jgi:hypothetical protein
VEIIAPRGKRLSVTGCDERDRIFMGNIFPERNQNKVIWEKITLLFLYKIIQRTNSSPSVSLHSLPPREPTLNEK